MRIGVISAIACGAVSVATVGAVATVSAKHPRGYTPVVLHANHKACKKTVINGINDKGTAIGTEFCGKPSTFVRSKGGKITPVVLEGHTNGVIGSNISSNGIMAVTYGHARVSSYLMYPNGQIVGVSYPSATASTIVNGVNRHGVAVGYYCLNRKCRPQHPFIYRHGDVHDFTWQPKHGVLPSLSSISDNETLSGFLFHAPGGYLQGFVKRRHHVRIVNAPHAGRKLGQGTLILGAANHGAICGDVFGKHHLSAAWVQHHGHMHLINLHPSQRKSYTELLACNSRGEIGGHSYNAHTRLNAGFLAKVR